MTLFAEVLGRQSRGNYSPTLFRVLCGVTAVAVAMAALVLDRIVCVTAGWCWSMCGKDCSGP